MTGAAVRQHPVFELIGRYHAILTAAWAARRELAGPKRLADETAFMPAALSLQETPVHPAPRRAAITLCALFLAALWPDRLRAMSAALGLWLLMVVAYDLAVLGATTILNGLPLQSVLLPALLLNPVDLARVLVTMAVGAGALFGPTSAVLMHTLGSTTGIIAGVCVLLIETLVPLVAAIYVFERRDW